MASDLRPALLDEIALEGLDGITINALWLRLSEREGFTLSLDDSTKQYVWKCVLGLTDVELFELPEPRPDLVSYNRFHYVDPESKHFLETDHMPEEIYPINLISENGILGSCATYETRVNITESVKEQKLDLQQAVEQYGNKLVLVAKQDVRLRALMGEDNNPSFVFDDPVMYGILERIGRSRTNGESTLSQVFQTKPITLHYLLKKLRPLNLLRKQRLCTITKKSNHKLSSHLYHLNRYYKEVGTRSQHELMTVATYLADKPEQMAEVLKIKTDLKLFSSFKRITKVKAFSGDRLFIFIDVPYRSVHPTATTKEYLSKNGQGERMIRHMRMIKSLEEVRIGLDRGMEWSDDEDDEEALTDDLPKIEYTEMFDQPQLYQFLKVIKEAGPRGVSQVELRQLTDRPRLIIRRVAKFLERSYYVNTVMMDRGRQKIVMFVAKDKVESNTSQKSLSEEMKNFESTKKQTTKSPKPYALYVRDKKEQAVIELQKGLPTEENVVKVKQELTKVDETLSPCQKYVPACEVDVMKEYRSGMSVNVKLEEIIPEHIIERGTKKRLLGLKRFITLTESHVRRCNWVLEVLGAIKVIENFKLLKLMRNREREMNIETQMDSKSLKRIINALIEEKRVRSYKAYITMPNKSKEIVYMCDESISSEHETLLRMIDEAKLRHFGLSKEVMLLRNIMASTDEKTSQTEGVKKEDNIPESAKESIAKYQEYRKKVTMAVPSMKYDRKAGIKYGHLPKMLRLQAVHQYLYHLCYSTFGEPVKTGSSSLTRNVTPSTSGETIRTGAPNSIEDKVDIKEFKEEDDGWNEAIPPLYYDEYSWRRYVPPIPVHAGYPRGWCLISDVLLIMPVFLFCRIVNVCYNIEGLAEILDHPTRRFYPVRHLPFKISQMLLHSRKYVQSFLDATALLAEFGMLSFGRVMLKDKDQTFVYLHKNIGMLDTRDSLHGYNKTHLAEGSTEFKLKKFKLDTLQDLMEFWEFTQIVACNSNMGHKNYLHSDLDDSVSFEIMAIKDTSLPHDPDSVKDEFVVPGDRRGAAGFDSSLFVHAPKNWSFKAMPNHMNVEERVYYSKKDGLDLSGAIAADKEKWKIVGENRLKGKTRLVLSANPDQPIQVKKVIKENSMSNRSVKGGKRVRYPSDDSYRRIKRKDSLVTKRRIIKKIPKKTTKPPKKKAYEQGDEKDKEIYRHRQRLRVVWTQKEDSTILMCRLATLIMDNRRKTPVVLYTQMRDYLHNTCGEFSHDKSSQAVKRRITFVLHNPNTEANLLLYYREAMQDEFVRQNYVCKEFQVSDEELVPKFRTLVDYLLNKFKSLKLQKCSLPENLDELSKHYTIQYVGKLIDKKQYKDAQTKADVCHNVLRNILHSAVLIQDKQSRTHEMFKLLTQYPDILLCNVIRELRNDGLFVLNKKNYQDESLNQLHSGLGLRNFKVAQRYLYCFFKQRQMSTMFETSAHLVRDLVNHYVDNDGDDQLLTLPFKINVGQMATLFPLIFKGMISLKVKVPDEMVIMDLKGFYNFPWGRGKTYGFTTKGDKTLQEIAKANTEKNQHKGGRNRYKEAMEELSGQAIDFDDEELSREAMYDEELSREAIDDDDEEQSGEVTITVAESGELTVKESKAVNQNMGMDDHSYFSVQSDQDTTSAAQGTSSLVTLSKSEDEIVLKVKNGQTEQVSKHPFSPDLVTKKSQSAIDIDELAAGDNETSTMEPPAKKLTAKQKLNLCEVSVADNIKVTKSKSKRLDRMFEATDNVGQSHSAETLASVASGSAESVAVEAEETFTSDAQEYTQMQTRHSEVMIPRAEIETVADGMSSSAASRTLLSLRRAEDCSFEDIRVFNAQDNFVLKSCEIRMKLRDPDNQQLEQNFVKVNNRGPESDLIYRKKGNDSPTKQSKDSNVTSKMSTDNEAGSSSSKEPETLVPESKMTLEEKQAHAEKILLNQDKLKSIWNSMRKLLPFQLDMVQVWKDMETMNIDVDVQEMCKKIFKVIDEHGELGVRWYDLKKTFEELARLKHCLEVLVHHSIFQQLKG